MGTTNDKFNNNNRRDDRRRGKDTVASNKIYNIITWTQQYFGSLLVDLMPSQQIFIYVETIDALSF